MGTACAGLSAAPGVSTVAGASPRGGAAHDVRSSEARQAPSVGAGEYRYLFNATDATLAQKRVERCDQIARQRTNLVNKTVVADA